MSAWSPEERRRLASIRDQLVVALETVRRDGTRPAWCDLYADDVAWLIARIAPPTLASSRLEGNAGEQPNPERPTVGGAGPASASLGAYVTVRYRCPNICAPDDLEQAGMSFEEMVRLLIDEDGVIGLQDAEEIVSIGQFDDAAPSNVGHDGETRSQPDPLKAKRPEGPASVERSETAPEGAASAATAAHSAGDADTREERTP